MDSSIHRSIQGGRKWRRVAVGLVLCASLISAGSASAGTAGEISKQAGLGVGSAFATILYVPIKLTYATGGLLVGGLAWAFSGGDNDVASVVLIPSVLGDYVLTPEHLTRNQPIEFFGRDPDYSAEVVAVAAPPPMPDSGEGTDPIW